jgi:hypothetical protein
MIQSIGSKVTLHKFLYRLRNWETWHWLVKYIPMIPFWIAYCFKARSLWFFTAANPTLTFGGFEGENKREMYAQLPEGSYPKTLFISPKITTKELASLVLSRGFTFPLAVKPDIGRMGLMFRKVISMQQLHEYHRSMKADYLIQEFVDYPIEVSVFYYRMPDQQSGVITGFVRKECLSVIGNGSSSLLELMMNYPRVWFRMDEMKTKHAARLNDIIPEGETIILSDALNLSRGGKLVSLEHEKDDKLLVIFDQLSHKGNFYFGRYDIKCKTIEDLKDGNFFILEFNGAGAEPHHVYGNGNSLLTAISVLLEHWKILCEISIANRKRNIPFWSFKQGVEHLLRSKEHFRMLKQLESNAATSFINNQVQNNRGVTRHALNTRDLIAGNLNANGNI